MQPVQWGALRSASELSGAWLAACSSGSWLSSPYCFSPSLALTLLQYVLHPALSAALLYCYGLTVSPPPLSPSALSFCPIFCTTVLIWLNMTSWMRITHGWYLLFATPVQHPFNWMQHTEECAHLAKRQIAALACGFVWLCGFVSSHSPSISINCFRDFTLEVNTKKESHLKLLKQGSLIDPIQTNAPHKYSAAVVFANDYISDHCVTATVRNCKNSQKQGYHV